MGSALRSTSRWKKILCGIVLLILLALGGVLAWWFARGRDVLWSKIQPRDAALLEGQEIPSPCRPRRGRRTWTFSPARFRGGFLASTRRSTGRPSTPR